MKYKACFFNKKTGHRPRLAVFVPKGSPLTHFANRPQWHDWTQVGRSKRVISERELLFVSEQRDLFMRARTEGLYVRIQRWPNLVMDLEIELTDSGNPKVAGSLSESGRDFVVIHLGSDDDVWIDYPAGVSWPQTTSAGQIPKSAFEGVGVWLEEAALADYTGADLVAGLSPRRGISVIIASDGKVLWSAGTRSAEELIAVARPVLAKQREWGKKARAAQKKRSGRIQELLAEGYSQADALETAEGEGYVIPVYHGPTLT